MQGLCILRSSMLRLVFFSLLLPIVNSQYGNYGQSSYYNRCFNYCGYNSPMSSYPTNNYNYGYAFPRPGVLNPYGQNSMYDYSSSGFGIGNMGSYGLPYSGGLQGAWGQQQCRDQSMNCISMAQSGQCGTNMQIRSLCPMSCAVPQCLGGLGSGIGTMDALAGGGNVYGSPGYSSGIYSDSTVSFPFLQQTNFPPPMLREPFMLGPDGLPFMGDMGVGSLLPRPFDIFDEGNIFNSPFSSPYRKPANQSSITNLKKPKTDRPNTASNLDTFSNIVSLDQLISEMDKIK